MAARTAAISRQAALVMIVPESTTMDPNQDRSSHGSPAIGDLPGRDMDGREAAITHGTANVCGLHGGAAAPPRASMVWTRRLSTKWLAKARSFVDVLVGNGIVASGLARGMDTEDRRSNRLSEYPVLSPPPSLLCLGLSCGAPPSGIDPE